MRRIFIIVVLAILLVVQGAFSAQSLEDKVQEHHLDNGTTVLLVERHNSPTVAAYISFRVGGANETSKERGVAHLLEHMLFKGTKTLGTKDYATEKELLLQIKMFGQKIDKLKRHPEVAAAELQQLHERLALLQQEQQKLVVKNEFSRIYAENGGVGYNA
ncbi:MAG: insulinase family protein, partial [Desulfuromonadales bacterium]|nr:insulinase family protein [Desulfuromonadales bacterium]